MQLQLLRKSTGVSIYYDSQNDWLFVDWEGELTLPLVQAACVELADCFLQRPYSRVLNSNVQVTGLSWSIVAWLACDFLPHVTLAGVEHLAWICSPALRGRNLVQAVVNWLPDLVVTLFDDLEEAVDWLRHTNGRVAQQWPQRLPATQAKLALEIQTMKRNLAMHSPKAELA